MNPYVTTTVAYTAFNQPDIAGLNNNLINALVGDDPSGNGLAKESTLLEVLTALADPSSVNGTAYFLNEINDALHASSDGESTADLLEEILNAVSNQTEILSYNVTAVTTNAGVAYTAGYAIGTTGAIEIAVPNGTYEIVNSYYYWHTGNGITGISAIITDGNVTAQADNTVLNLTNADILKIQTQVAFYQNITGYGRIIYQGYLGVSYGDRTGSTNVKNYITVTGGKIVLTLIAQAASTPGAGATFGFTFKLRQVSV